MATEIFPVCQVEAKQPSNLWNRLGYQLYRTALGIWKFIVGAAFCQMLLTSIAVVGWTYRVAQRRIMKRWWKLSQIEKPDCFCNFVQFSSFHRDLGGWPNWILQNNRAWMRFHRVPGLDKTRAGFKALLFSLWLNFKIGVQALFNTLVFTLPAGALMLFAWYAGWHNSFNKGYEQAIVGPVLGIAGIFLFIAAMYYVPMAQMRQASTGNWRAFYQFKTVWQIIRKKWLSCFGLALLYTTMAVPFTILKTMPGYFPQINPGLVELPPTEALEFAKNYYFYAGFFVFGAFLFLRLVAAQIYASGLLACIQSGAVPEDALAENEWETLHQLDLLTIKPQPTRHVLVRTVTWLGTRVGRATTGMAMFLVWFAFFSQVYISEFLHKSPGGQGWLNQPLVQLPWFNYIPKALEDAGKTLPDSPPDWQGKAF